MENRHVTWGEEEIYLNWIHVIMQQGQAGRWCCGKRWVADLRNGIRSMAFAGEGTGAARHEMRRCSVDLDAEEIVKAGMGQCPTWEGAGYVDRVCSTRVWK